MKHLLTIYALALLASSSYAQTPIADGSADVAITFEAPITYDNGSPLRTQDLDGHVLFFGERSRFNSSGGFQSGCSATPLTLLDETCYPNVDEITASTSRSIDFTLTIDEDTTFYFAMSTYLDNGDWSDYSDEVSREFMIDVDDSRPPPLPGAPSITTITITVSCQTNTPDVTCVITAQ